MCIYGEDGALHCAGNEVFEERFLPVYDLCTCAPRT